MLPQFPPMPLALKLLYKINEIPHAERNDKIFGACSLLTYCVQCRQDVCAVGENMTDNQIPLQNLTTDIEELEPKQLELVINEINTVVSQQMMRFCL